MTNASAAATGKTHKNFQLPCGAKTASVDHTAAARSQQVRTTTVPAGSRPQISADPSRHSMVPLIGTIVRKRMPSQFLPKQNTAVFGPLNLKRPDLVSRIASLLHGAGFGDGV